MAFLSRELGSALSLLLLLYVKSSTSSHEGDDLVFVSIVYRHGDRSPVANFPDDPFPVSVWYEGLGQLSRTGMLQQYHLGEFLHQRYEKELEAKFIFDNYTRTQLYVRSTDVDRTLMSAQCQLAGLFKPGESQRFLADLNWQPIPVHTVPTSEDNVLQGYNVDCPTYQKLKSEIKDEPEYKKLAEQYKDFFKFLTNKTGEEISMDNVWQIADIVYVLYAHNMNLSWVNNTVRGYLGELSLADMTFMFDSKEKARLACGLLVNAILDEMHSKVNNSNPTEKIHFYSAHDTTVTCLLSALGVFDHKYPLYASAVIIEFYRGSDKSYTVEVKYKYGPLGKNFTYCTPNSTKPFNNTDDCLLTFKVPGCSSKTCVYEEFVKALSDVSPQNWFAECGLGEGSQASSLSTLNIILITVCGVLAVLLVVLTCLFCCCFCKKRRKGSEYTLLNTNVG